MSYMKASYIILLALFVAGCATTGQQNSSTVDPVATPEMGKALVVFCRAKALQGMAWDHHYYIDRQYVAALSSGSHTQVSVTPRQVEISTGPKKNPVAKSLFIDVEDGRVYYVIDDPGNTPSFGVFKMSDAEECSRRSGKYSPPTVGSIE